MPRTHEVKLSNPDIESIGTVFGATGLPVNSDKWGEIIGGVVVLPLWVWIAVQTTKCLRVITRYSIPYKRRAVWLIKILALVVGAGGVVGISLDAGIPWFVAVVPAVLIVFFAVREPVAEIIPPKPTQDAPTYESAWREYYRLRRVGIRWVLLSLTPVLFVLFIFVLFTPGQRLPESVWSALITMCFMAVIASSVVSFVHQWKWYRWPCPRCGCSFRGAWRWWLPKHCVYCGLPREERK
jgi:hypothetical protein